MAEAAVETNAPARFYCHICDVDFRETAHVRTKKKLVHHLPNYKSALFHRTTLVRTAVTAS